jgi:hypothetical protein
VIVSGFIASRDGSKQAGMATPRARWLWQVLIVGAMFGVLLALRI